MDQERIIVAPHPDDECIGTYEILQKNDNSIVIYDGDTPKERREEALKLRKYYPSIKQIYLKTIPDYLRDRKNIFYLPDPIYEIHPLHRHWGHIGEMMARDGLNVIFYNTNMNAPYIHEVKTPDKKELILSEIYPSQSTLWRYERKYILFEGYTKWIF